MQSPSNFAKTSTVGGAIKKILTLGVLGDSQVPSGTQSSGAGSTRAPGGPGSAKAPGGESVNVMGTNVFGTKGKDLFGK